jgi:hypothetical protein
MAGSLDKPRIFVPGDSVPATTVPSIADGSKAVHGGSRHKSLESGRALSNGMSQHPPALHTTELALDHAPARRNSSYFDSVRASQGWLPKLQFPVFNGEDPQLWRSRCETYFDIYGVETSL